MDSTGEDSESPLIPRSSFRRKGRAATTTNGGPKTAEMLEELSRYLIYLIHSNQLDDPAISRHFSPILEANWHCFPTTDGLHAFRSICKALWSNNSNEPIGVSEMCAVAEERKHTATVWVTMTAATVKVNSRQENVCKMDWQLGRKGWLCVRITNMRAPDFSGMF